MATDWRETREAVVNHLRKDCREVDRGVVLQEMGPVSESGIQLWISAGREWREHCI